MNALSDEQTEALKRSHPEWKQSGSTGEPVREYRVPVSGAAPGSVDHARECKYAAGSLADDCADLAAMGPESGRNNELNRIAFKMARFIGCGWLEQGPVVSALHAAYRANGGIRDHGQRQFDQTVNGALKNGARVGTPDVDWHKSPAPHVEVVTSINGHTAAPWEPPPPAEPTNGHINETAENAGRIVKLTPISTIIDDLPDWVWNYGGKGRIQLGTLTMLAGRPGSGKSTASRWFSSQLTNGTLDGIWKGQPVNVAYLAAEEQIDVLVKPSLRAVGADMSRIYCIGVEMDGNEASLKSIQDEHALIEALVAANVRAVVIDPIMATIGSSADIYKNNEVRAHLEPYPRIAKAINGIVLGIAHLNKQAAKDVVAGINGSSAFGEVPRAVFGFAKDDSSDEGDRIMSQSKNSAGAEDLALVYRIKTTTVHTERRGRVGEMAYFDIIGDSQVSVEDVMSAEIGQHSKVSEVKIWLQDTLEIGGPTLRQEVMRAGKAEGYSESSIKRAAAELRVQSYQGAATPDKPRRALWALLPPTAPRDFSEKDHTDDE